MTMDGKKFVLALFALVALVSTLTFVLYLLTRQLDLEEEVEPSPSGAIVRQLETLPPSWQLVA